MKKKIVIYHNPCSDGMTAAWVIHHKYPDAIYYPIAAGSNNPPNVDGKDVIMVDCCYPRDTLLRMQSAANSIIVLDHHLTAMETVGELDFCKFDMNKSGAGLAWDYIFPGQERHWIVKYVEDKDLNKFAEYRSREVNCVIQSYPLSFDSLYWLEKCSEKDTWTEGEAILRYQKTLVDSIIQKSQDVDVEGYNVRACNTCILQSEVAAELATEKPFGIAWYVTNTGERIYSFRSNKESNVNVAKIAARFGGGGHYLASGCRTKNIIWAK